MQYLNESDKLKVKECFGYYYISGKEYKEWFLSPSDKIKEVDEEEFFKVYQFSLNDKYESKIKERLPPYYSSLTYVITHEDDMFDVYDLCYTEYNTSSPFALFLSTLDFYDFESENEEEN